MVLLQRFYREGVPNNRLLFVEGLFAAAIGVGFGTWLFPKEASLVAVFLCAISAEDSIERLLGDNRKSIMDKGEAPRRANLRLVHRVLWLFAGAFLGFSVMAMVVPDSLLGLIFNHQIEDYGDAHFPSLVLGNTGALFVHNAYVVLFFFLIAVPFRHDGVVLAVAWNASVWGATFGVLARRWAHADGPGLVEGFLRIMSACVGHMALEASAYVLAGMAGVFVSRGIMRYSLDSVVLSSILRTVCVMLACSLALVAFGAIWEGHLAPHLVQFFSDV